MHFSQFSAALAASLATGSMAALDKPALWSNMKIVTPVVNFLAQSPIKSLVAHKAGELREGCYARIKLAKKDPTTFRMYTVNYEDCGEGWTLCQEQGQGLDINELATQWGRVPVHLRSKVNDIVHWKGSGGSAWNRAGCTVSFGSSGQVSVPVMIHEASHCVDFNNDIGLKSNSEAWQAAYNKSTHVPDNYAKSSHAENFAQHASLIIYSRRLPDDKKFVATPEYKKIKSMFDTWAQYADMAHSWGSRILDTVVTGQKCTTRRTKTAIVDAKTGKVLTRRRDNMPQDPEFIYEPLLEAREEPELSDCTQL